MKPFHLIAVAVFVAVLTVTCVVAHEQHIDSAAADQYDDDDDDDDGRSNVIDRDQTDENRSPQWDDVISNKCNDPTSGYKYKVGETWYSDGCIRRACIYSLEQKTTLVRTEKCKCKECPPGMECSTEQRAETKDARYPQCCPMTVCVPAGRTVWAFFKPNNWRGAFSKLMPNKS